MRHFHELRYVAGQRLVNRANFHRNRWTHSLVRSRQPANWLHVNKHRSANCELFVCKTTNPNRCEKIPDSLASTSSRTNQSSLKCVCVSGRLSSRIRFSNCGLVSEIVTLVLVTAVGALSCAGNCMRSGTVTTENTQPGITVEIQFKTIRHLHLQ